MSFVYFENILSENLFTHSSPINWDLSWEGISVMWIFMLFKRLPYKCHSLKIELFILISATFQWNKRYQAMKVMKLSSNKSICFIVKNVFTICVTSLLKEINLLSPFV